MTIAAMVAVVGWAGAAMILASYALLTLGRVRADGGPYQWLNLLGGVCFVVNSGWNGAMPSAALNVVWAGIALVALVRIARRSRDAAIEPLAR